MEKEKSSRSKKKKNRCKVRPTSFGIKDQFCARSSDSIHFFYGYELLYLQAEKSHVCIGIDDKRRVAVNETQETCCGVLGQYLTYIGPGLSLNLTKIRDYEKGNENILFTDGSQIQIKHTEAEALCKLMSADCSGE